GQALLAGPFWRLKKVPRCKSETIISAPTNAGYTHKTQRQPIAFKRLKSSLIRANVLAKMPASHHVRRFANKTAPTDDCFCPYVAIFSGNQHDRQNRHY
ncbi:hypothetical protein QN386_16830, partial [Pseudomonas sp. CCI3.2]|uniref:hypothetical protein n=1 Tax=unclassified Pseudomonas TaxID=196821 RepID=UPI002B22A70C